MQQTVMPRPNDPLTMLEVYVIISSNPQHGNKTARTECYVLNETISAKHWLQLSSTTDRQTIHCNALTVTSRLFQYSSL